MNIRKFLKPKTLSDFVKLEDGIVGGKTALNIAAVVGASILAELFLASNALAHTCCSHSQWFDGSNCHHECSEYICPDLILECGANCISNITPGPC